jgi:RNA polymerase sigma factor (sigma-70 family)
VSVQNEPSSAELLDRYRDGDARAAELIFERYSARLVALASSRLSSRLSSRVDAEDVTLSAWRSFFIGAGEGRFEIGRGGDLWRLLVSITLHKLYRQARRHSAARRSVAVEYPLAFLSAEVLPANDREPTPEEAATLADELQAIMQSLDPFMRRTLELRLQGEQIEEIARVTGRSERTVRRALATLRESISARAERLQ